jgi:tRNA (5-methylaminomethyl-2-thiouridylate)-methyltransferase
MRVAMLMSGGVDSSVAAVTLKKQGYEVTAFYLKIWLEDELAYLGDCPWEEDLKYVRQICEEHDIPLEIINLQTQYFDKVVSYAIDEVKLGRTPNPDLFCNSRIKFGAFFDFIDESYDKVATGHYADIGMLEGTTILKRVRDQIKDQTYFLAHLTKKQIERALFPLAQYTKPRVRELATEYNLPNKDRKDSQGICFLGKLKYNDFLKHYLGEVEGDIIDIKTDKVLAQHKGYWYHTVGQRKGTGLGHGPWYVVKKDVDKNIVYVSNEYDTEKKDTFFVDELNLFTDLPKSNLKVKVRHGQQMYDCTIKKIDDRYQVTLQGNDQGLAPGQFAVFYDEQYCYGCGVITE